MELTQLQHFLKVAEHRSFTRAADALVMSQPALSRSVAKLEEELGQPLFERRSRSVELTDAGKLLEARARQVFALIEDTRAEISDDGSTGRLRIGAIPTIAPYLLPSILRAFATSHPRCQLTVQEEVTERLVHQVQQGEVDIALLALPITAKYLEAQALFDEELFLVLPPSHPLATRKKLTIADVQGQPFVLLGEAHCLSDTIVSFCRREQFQPVAVERTSQLTTVQELVALGHGVSLIPAMAREIDTSDRRVYRSLSGDIPKRSIAAVWNPYRFQSRLMQAFLEQLRELRSCSRKNSN